MSCLLEQEKYKKDKYFSFVIKQSMMLTPTLWFILYLIITKHMSYLSTGNNKKPRFLMSNKKNVQKTIIKYLLS